jgi:pimeloyl-ACP methyl ester carboxylesterase
VPDGEPGDLYIQGPSAAMMYWGNRAKTRETFQGGWTKSGDKYVRNADGSYTYSGRSDDMLKVSGIYVSPFEVEATLVQHPAVLEAAVIGVPDAEGLTKTKAFVVLKPGARPRGRAEGLRQGPAGALQVPAPDRVRRPSCRRRPPARSSASSCANGKRELSGGRASAVAPFVDIDWAGRPVRIEHAWRGRADRPARAPLIVFLHEGLGSVAMWRDFPARLCDAARRCAAWSIRARATAAARRAPARPGAWTSCTARRTRCCRRCCARWASTPRRAALAVRPQRRRLDRAAVRGAVSRRAGRRHRAGAAHPGRGPVGRQHRKAREAYETPTCASAWPATTTTPTRPSGAGTDIWLHPPFRAWSIEAEIGAIRCPVLAVQGLDDEYGTLEQIRGIARRVPQTQLLELPACGHSPHRDQPRSGARSRACCATRRNPPAPRCW